MTMKRAKVSELKARLSAYLADVRQGDAVSSDVGGAVDNPVQSLLRGVLLPQVTDGAARDR